MNIIRTLIVIAGMIIGFHANWQFFKGTSEDIIPAILFETPAAVFLVWFGIDYLEKYDKLDKE